MRIYTKTGDNGETGLLGGARVSKADVRMDAIGDVDELNSTLGLVRLAPLDLRLQEALEKVQSLLFDLGAELASTTNGKAAHEALTEDHIAWLEGEIDFMTGKMEPLQQFILPGGSTGAVYLHLARTVCRRAERSIVRLDQFDGIRTEAKTFVNRLSDWLFTAARFANHCANVPDVPWKSSE